MVRITSLIVCLFALSACASTEHASSSSNTCKINHISEVEVSISYQGDVNEDLVTCLNQSKKLEITELVIDSPGGKLDPSLAAAEILDDHDFKLVVRNECNSACANYILPLSDEVEFYDGAVVVIHGAADEFMLNKLTPEPSSTSRDRNMMHINRQNKFLITHGINFGWLLYRVATPQGYEILNVNGEFRPQEGKVQRKSFLPEQIFFESCLPQIKIHNFENSDNFQISKNISLRRKYGKSGMVGTGSVTCMNNAVPTLPVTK